MPITAAPLAAEWRECLELFGKALEWLGVLLTASRYFCFRPEQRWKVFLSAVYRGKMAKDGVYVVKELTEDDLLGTLQGVALILLGVALQTIPFWYAVLPAVWQLLPPGG